MKRVFYFVITIVIVSMVAGCAVYRKAALNRVDYGRQVYGSMEPIDFSEKYPSVPLQQIPSRSDLIKGVLDNGLTYYILRGDNEKNSAFQPGKACFRLVQNTGSLVEDDHKTGVAHFVEHYAFNGTTHFSGNAAIELMRKIGINFGNDANACTSWDCTQYMLDNVPVANDFAYIDSCLWLLRDWACALTFDPKHFERERSVILEEYRLRVPMMGYKQARAFLDGTRYRERMPIGTEDDLKRLTIDDLKDYYKKWYQPQNQAVVVFGDVDSKLIEVKIKEIFGSIPRGGSQVPRYQYTPTRHTKPKAYVFADKIADRAYFDICFSLAADSLVRHRNTSAWYIGSNVRWSIFLLLKNRLERIQKETMLINDVTVDTDPVLFEVKDDYPITIRFNAPQGNWRQALEVVAAEIEKIKRYGWTKRESESGFHKGIPYLPYVNIADSIKFNKGEKLGIHIEQLSPQILTSNFVYGTPIYDESIMGVMDYRTIYGTSPSMAHDYYCRIASDSNVVIMLSMPENADMPTSDEVMDAYMNVRDTDLEPSKFQYAEEPYFYGFIDNLPTNQTPGKVVATKKSNLKKCTELTLSNGVKVIVTKVGGNRNFVSVRMLRFGELGCYTDDEAKRIKLLPQLVANKFSGNNYNKANLLSSMSLGDCDEFMYDSRGLLCTESVLKYIHYTLTDSSIDSTRFANYKQQLVLDAGKDFNPLYAFNLLWRKALYGKKMGDREQSISQQELERLTISELQSLYDSYTSNYDGALFIIKTGYSVGLIQPLIEKYLGSLPKNVRQSKVGSFNVSHSNDSLSYKSPVQMPRADIFYGYAMDSDAPYSQERDIVSDAFINILDQCLYDKIRLDNGNVYALSARYNLPTYEWQGENLRVNVVCAPSYAATLLQKIDQIIRQMAYGDLITEQMLREYVNGKIINLPRKIKDKEYFDYVCNYYKNQCTDRRVTDEKLLRALTVDKVRALAREFLEKGYKKQVVISTEE